MRPPGVDELAEDVGSSDSSAFRRGGDRSARGGVAGRVFIGGLIGGLPGLVLALTPLLLHEVDVLTADQSQIGFLGVPLLFLGVFVGSVLGAAESGCDRSVALGASIGFVVGLAAGSFIAASASVGVVGLLIAPTAMIAGGALAARRCARLDRPS